MCVNEHDRGEFHARTFKEHGSNLDEFIVSWTLQHFQDQHTLNAEEFDDIILLAVEEHNQEKVK